MNSKVRAAMAFVQVSLEKKGFTKDLNNMQKQMRSFGATTAKIGGGMLAVGVGMVAPFTDFVSVASDASEGLNKFNAVFKESATAAEEFAQTMSKEVGRSVIDLRNQLAQFGAKFTGLGATQEEARELSQEIVSLAADFGSFFNVADEEAVRRLSSALAGSAEVLDTFGINVRASAVNAKLLEQGIEGGSKAATELQKALAIKAIIRESMGRQGALGDAVKTAGSFENQMKRLTGKFKDARAELGQALLPILEKFLTSVMPIVDSLVEWIKQNQELVITVAAVGAGLIALGSTLVTTGLLVSSFATVWGSVGTAMAVLTGPAGLLALAVAGLVAIEEASVGAIGALLDLNAALLEEVKLRTKLKNVEADRQTQQRAELDLLEGPEKAARAGQILAGIEKNIETLTPELAKLRIKADLDPVIRAAPTELIPEETYRAEEERLNNLRAFAVELREIAQQGQLRTGENLGGVVGEVKTAAQAAQEAITAVQNVKPALAAVQAPTAAQAGVLQQAGNDWREAANYQAKQTVKEMRLAFAQLWTSNVEANRRTADGMTRLARTVQTI